MKRIELSKGYYAIVDDCDYEELNKYSWYYAHGYAQRSQQFGSRSDGSRRVKTYRMHAQIMGFPKCDIDHANMDKLDNRRANLRLCTRSQNVANTKVNPRNRLGIKGVCRRGNRFIARIRVRGVLYHIGSFSTAEAASNAYSEAALIHFGQFARTA